MLPSPAKLPPGAKRHLLLAALLLAVAPFIINCSFAHPQTDDFTYSVVAKDVGFLNAQYQWYTAWTGRFTSSALLSLNPLVFNSISGYKFALALLVVAQIASIHLLVSAFAKGALSWQQRLTFALALAFAFYDQMDDIRSGLYWMAGVVTYQVAESLLMLYLASLIYLNGRSGSRFLKCITVVISVLLCGTNEIMAVVTFLLTALVLYHTYAGAGTVDRFHMILLGAAAAGTSVALLAPGNFVRLNLYTEHKSVFLTAVGSFQFATSLVGTWATAPLTLVLMYLVFGAVTGTPGLRKGFQAFRLPGSTAALFVVTFASVFIPFYSTGAPPQNRVINMIYLLFLVGWLLNVAVFSAHFGEMTLAMARSVTGSGIIAALLVIALLPLQTSNLALVANDVMSGSASRYDVELQRREFQVRSSRDDAVTVEPLTNTPASLYFYFVGVDDKDWVNRYYAEYFAKKSVALRRPHRVSGP